MPTSEEKSETVAVGPTIEEGIAIATSMWREHDALAAQSDPASNDRKWQLRRMVIELSLAIGQAQRSTTLPHGWWTEWWNPPQK